MHWIPTLLSLLTFAHVGLRVFSLCSSFHQNSQLLFSWTVLVSDGLSCFSASWVHVTLTLWPSDLDSPLTFEPWKLRECNVFPMSSSETSRRKWIEKKKKKNTVESGGEGETQERAWLDFSSRQTLLQSDRTPARYWFQNSHHHKCNASPQAVVIPHISLAWFQGLFPPNDLVSLCIMATIIFFSYKCIYFPSNTLRYWLSRSTRTMGRK